MSRKIVKNERIDEMYEEVLALIESTNFLSFRKKPASIEIGDVAINCMPRTFLQYFDDLRKDLEEDSSPIRDFSINVKQPLSNARHRLDSRIDALAQDALDRTNRLLNDRLVRSSTIKALRTQLTKIFSKSVKPFNGGDLFFSAVQNGIDFVILGRFTYGGRRDLYAETFFHLFNIGVVPYGWKQANSTVYYIGSL